MERRERGFFGKVLVFFLTLLALIGLVAMALCVINPYINPKHFVWTSFFGLAFWVIFIYNVLILLFLVLLWSKKAWIAVLALLISIPGFNKSFSFGSKKAEDANSIRLMSYNVYMFESLDGKKDSEASVSRMMRVIREQSPDILCCQEFSRFSKKISRNNCIKMFADSIDMPFVYFNRKSNFGGNVIFSKFPITKVTEGTGFSQEETYGVLVTVDAGEKGIFYLADIHLVSNMITSREIDKLTQANDYQQTLDTVGKSVIKKLIHACVLRSDEVEEMLQGMPPIDGPAILCGDFNDTPMSYTYRRIKKAGFSDVFTKVGRGIKPTYAGKLPLLRIDYFWANDGVTPLNFKRCRYKASDHYPIILDFSINSVNQSVNINQTTNTL